MNKSLFLRSIPMVLFTLIKIINSVPVAEEKPVDKLLDGLAIHYDEYDCCMSCGYNYCPSLDTCVRSWETYCQEFQFPYNALWYGSGIVVDKP
tara:strand:+ start:274 stop:552 length:279 start_codon:yes stop_codon:yes gene_type:complete